MARPDAREKLVAAGLQLLHARGYNASAVQDITDAAGVPKGSFYNYFASKDAFALEVLERYWQGLRLLLKPLRDPASSPARSLRAHFAAMAAALSRWNFRKGCMIGNFGAELSDQSEEVRARLAAIAAEWTRTIEAAVRAAAEAGELEAELDPATAASFLVSSWEGAVLRSKIDKSSTALDDFLDVAFTAIFNLSRPVT